MSYRAYRLEIVGDLTVETFHIGSGLQFSLTTDAPILRDVNGNPYVPASSMRGVLRSHLEREVTHTGGQIGALFGQTPEKGGEEHSHRGRLSVFDSVVKTASGTTETRDHCAINPRWGAAASGAKFDQEVAAGVWKMGFRVIYEGDGAGDAELALLKEGLRALTDGDLTCGANRSRGYGRLKLEKVLYLSHDRAADADLAAWLGYRKGKQAAWQSTFTWPAAAPTGEAGAAASQSVLEFELKVQFDGPVLVRAPIPPVANGRPFAVTDAASFAEKGETTADHVFVTTGPDGRKYLPGASLRGALRHRAMAIRTEKLGDAETVFEGLFGSLKGTDGRKGTISVGDGELLGEPRLIYLDHVAIDRITGFAADKKKFSTCALQSPAFRVRVRIWFADDELASLALAGFVLRDLREGLLWCGGGSSRGYGYISSAAIEKITGDFTEGVAPGEGDFPDGVRTCRSGRVRVEAKATKWKQLQWLWAKAESAWKVEAGKK